MTARSLTALRATCPQCRRDRFIPIAFAPFCTSSCRREAARAGAAGTAAPFRLRDAAAAVEHDASGKPREHGAILCATVTEAGPCSVLAQFGSGETRLFLLDSRGRAWREGGRWRLVPLCAGCEGPVTGTPVKAEDDPLDRTWCSEDCLTASAEGAAGQRYPSGVAT